MRPRLIGLVIPAMLLAFAPVRADEAGDMFFDGYQAWRAGESLANQGEMGAARVKLLSAEMLLINVQKRFPGWSADVVAYRLKQIRQKLAELQPPENPAVPAVPHPAPGMPMRKPDPAFFNRPAVPFSFNGGIYFKMLLSSRGDRGAADCR